VSGYLDSAVMGVVIVEPQLKQSARGTAYCRFLLAVGEGEGKQFCWVCAFNDDAERVAPLLRKGGKAYAEGTLSSEIYMRDGQPTVSLSIAARRVEALNQIGRNRPKQDRRDHGGHGSRHPQHERPDEWRDAVPF
jgi:single-stranded DNA-binding protein